MVTAKCFDAQGHAQFRAAYLRYRDILIPQAKHEYEELHDQFICQDNGDLVVISRRLSASRPRIASIRKSCKATRAFTLHPTPCSNPVTDASRESSARLRGSGQSDRLEWVSRAAAERVGTHALAHRPLKRIMCGHRGSHSTLAAGIKCWHGCDGLVSQGSVACQSHQLMQGQCRTWRR